MTDEQLERMVSEAIEPFVSLPEYRGTGYHGPSPKDCWYWHSLSQRWTQAPWLTDDRYAMRLVDSMPEPVICKQKRHDDWLCDVDTDDPAAPVARDKDRRRAIVLAYLLWKDISLEGGTE